MRITSSPRTTGRLQEVAAYRGDAASVASARSDARALFRVAGRRIGTWTAETVHDALLVLSELVGNAVRHAPGPFTVRLRFGPRGVDVAVADGSPVLPAERPADATGGRGWGIVAALAEQVRARRTAGGGKVVSAVVPAQAGSLPNGERGPTRTPPGGADGTDGTNSTSGIEDAGDIAGLTAPGQTGGTSGTGETSETSTSGTSRTRRAGTTGGIIGI